EPERVPAVQGVRRTVQRGTGRGDAVPAGWGELSGLRGQQPHGEVPGRAGSAAAPELHLRARAGFGARMTCIVAIKDGGSVWMGGDSAGCSGFDLTIRDDAKVFRNGPYLIG